MRGLFVDPLLPPVLDCHTIRADEDVLHRYTRAAVIHQYHYLKPSRMLRVFPYVTGFKYSSFIKVESYLIFTEHGKDGATVTFERAFVERTAGNWTFDVWIAVGFVVLCHVHFICTRSE